MSKRNDPVARARGRATTPVKKPFPVGFVLGSVALAAALVGILVYAVQNQGAGDTSSLKYAQNKIDGLVNKADLGNQHVEGTVSYPGSSDTPPVGGDHSSTPQSCQVYTAPIANEHAVHSLEHGAVWVTYNPTTLSKDDLETLTEKVGTDPYRLLSPYPGLKSKISLQAWGEQLFVDSVEDKRIGEFLKLFTYGPQKPEKGAVCDGTTQTGALAGQTPEPGSEHTK